MATAADDLAKAVTQESAEVLRQGLVKIRHCLAQLDDEQVWWRPHPSLNSIANLLLHLSGNLGQWIVSGIGGAPDVRNRPQEFAERRHTPASELFAQLESTVAQCDRALSGVDAATLLERRRIQGFDVTVLHALIDTVAHFRGHVQEIIHMTRAQVGDGYKFHWQPRTPEQGAAT